MKFEFSWQLIYTVSIVPYPSVSYAIFDLVVADYPPILAAKVLIRFSAALYPNVCSKDLSRFATRGFSSSAPLKSARRQGAGRSDPALFINPPCPTPIILVSRKIPQARCRYRQITSLIWY
jgi:hypothetical protein